MDFLYVGMQRLQVLVQLTQVGEAFFEVPLESGAQLYLEHIDHMAARQKNELDLSGRAKNRRLPFVGVDPVPRYAHPLDLLAIRCIERRLRTATRP